MSNLDDALAAIWERSKPIVSERLTTLEAAAAAPRDEAARAEGLRASHQLAGSLGTFGLHEGSDVARAFEHELEGPAEPARLAQLSAQLRALLGPRLA